MLEQAESSSNPQQRVLLVQQARVALDQGYWLVDAAQSDSYDLQTEVIDYQTGQAPPASTQIPTSPNSFGELPDYLPGPGNPDPIPPIALPLPTLVAQVPPSPDTNPNTGSQPNPQSPSNPPSHGSDPTRPSPKPHHGRRVRARRAVFTATSKPERADPRNREIAPRQSRFFAQTIQRFGASSPPLLDTVATSSSDWPSRYQPDDSCTS